MNCKLFHILLAAGGLSGCLLHACTERMDITTGNAAPRPVITGYITTDSVPHHIHISRTVAYFGAVQPQTFSDAVVKINGRLLQSLGDGLYATPAFRGVSGETYTLEAWVDFEGDGTPDCYTATTTMPAMCTLDSVTLAPILSNSYRPMVYFNNPYPTANFGAHLYVRDTLRSNTIGSYYLHNIGNEAGTNRYIVFPILGYVLHSEMRGSEGDRRIPLYPGDTVTIELNVLSPEYFEYIRTARTEISGSNPLFAGPPANVPGNISGGALGIFGAYTTSRKSTVLPPADYW